MFDAFFYTLKANDVPVSMTEWLTLMEGLRQNLHGTDLNGMYQLCRAVLVKREQDYDKFDAAFLSYFYGVEPEGALSEELLHWLNHPSFLPKNRKRMVQEPLSEEEILKKLEERKREQKEEHNGGSYWIGTKGYTSFGTDGSELNGIRIVGKAGHRSAFQVAGERKYRDFRKDNKLDPRQFQMVFRMLRQLSSSHQVPEDAFDVNKTIRATCDRGGMLDIQYSRPRENAIKLLLLMDSGGSIEDYCQQCSMLFQAASRANRFKRFETYYFHNCVKCFLYTQPTLERTYLVETEEILRKFGPEYRVILVGDAMMSPGEFFHRYPRNGGFEASGADWLLRLKRHFPHIIWVNPGERPGGGNGYWARSYDKIADTVEMFPLTVDGLERGVKKLLS